VERRIGKESDDKRHRSRMKPENPAKRYRKIRLRREEWGPAFTPDGKQVAFVWKGEQDNRDIYVQLVDEAIPRRLTTNPPSTTSRLVARRPPHRFPGLTR
jgi:Tol biopolymer transport system component